MQNLCKNEYAIMSSSYAVSVCVPEGAAFEVCGFQKTPHRFGSCFAFFSSIKQEKGGRR